jgi:hypothetical protein
MGTNSTTTRAAVRSTPPLGNDVLQPNSPAARAAAAALQQAYDIPMASALPLDQLESLSREEIGRIAARLVGRSEAFAANEQLNRVARIATYKVIKETRVYREYADNWSQFCRAAWNTDHATIDEQIRWLDAFGPQVLGVLLDAGLSRDAFREIRRPESDIRFLRESNEIVLGEEVIPVTQENQTRIAEAFTQLLNREKDEKVAVEKKLAESEATIAKGRAQLEAKEEELADKENQIKVAASILAVMRHDHPLQAAADAIEVRLAELIQQMRDDGFDKSEAVRIHRRLSERITDLARYAHGATLDPDAAFQRLSPEMQEIVRSGDAEHEMDPYFEELGDEEGDDA